MQINEITFINLEFNATLSFVFFELFNKHRIVRNILDYTIPNSLSKICIYKYLYNYFETFDIVIVQELYNFL